MCIYWVQRLRSARDGLFGFGYDGLAVWILRWVAFFITPAGRTVRRNRHARRDCLAGLAEHNHAAVVTELGIRWAKRHGAMLVGLAVVDEPGIRAIEPSGPVGGTPGLDPVYYMGYEARLASVHRQADRGV